MTTHHITQTHDKLWYLLCFLNYLCLSVCRVCHSPVTSGMAKSKIVHYMCEIKNLLYEIQWYNVEGKRLEKMVSKDWWLSVHLLQQINNNSRWMCWQLRHHLGCSDTLCDSEVGESKSKVEGSGGARNCFKAQFVILLWTDKQKRDTNHKCL